MDDKASRLNKNLLEWLEAFGTRDSINDNISAVRKAQQACPVSRPQIQPLPSTQQNPSTTQDTTPAQNTNNSSCPCLKAGLFADGKVPAGCPFAGSASKKSTVASVAACPVLTKQASLEADSSNSQIKRASFAASAEQDPMTEAPAASVSGSANLQTCPIRFLDQHSPEAIAEYFEEHKHELPRSHEICVQRFQANDQSIRALDAKYGNLVSMIQGLGQKHQSMLSHEPKPDIIEESDDTESKQKIQKWASAVSEYQGSNPAADVEEADDEASNKDDDGRESRFDRSLREVRVGESPSRPWGMHVPPHILDRRISTASTLPARHDEVVQNSTANTAEGNPVRPMGAKRQPSTLLHSVIEEPGPAPVVEFRTRPVGGTCPFGHSAGTQPQPTTHPTSQAQAQSSTDQAPQPEMLNERPVMTNANNDNITNNEPPPQGIVISNPQRQIPQPAGEVRQARGIAAVQTPSHTTNVASPAQPPPDYTDNQESSHRPIFTNHGVAIVLSSDVIDAMADVQNMGTMILGYQAEEALHIANGLRPARP